jgi:hypothetical protein
MNLKDHPSVIVITVVLAAAAFAWKVGYDTCETRVKTLEAQIAARDLSDKLQLPKLLSDISTASKQLGDGLETSRQVAALQMEIEEIKGREQQLKQQLKAAQDEKIQIESKLRQSEKIVQSLYSKVATFSVHEHSAKDLLGYDLAVGVRDVGVRTVNVTFGNQKATLDPGDELTATQRGKTCTLRLQRVNFDQKSADFTFFVKQ